jgi:alpha-beta hydrolase superfamily lysophospholipase
MWEPDVLGQGFEQLTMALPADAEGEVVATLVRYSGPARFPFPRRVASGANVLYVHGWSDYFFQRELAEFWHGQGANFYAVDLRKYGRSLRPHQTPGYVADLGEYDLDIDAAIGAMTDSTRPLILMGHSTGGLTLSLWAARNPTRAAALVLNSPWLEFQGRAGARTAFAPLVSMQAKYRPMDLMPGLDLGYYARSTSSHFEGSWDYNLDWRPERSFPARAGWLNAILAGHAAVAAGLHLSMPVAVWLSSRSLLQPRWDPAMMQADVAIDVEVVADRAAHLGETVTLLRIEGAMHDVTLSAPPVRARAYAGLSRWLGAYAPRR